MQIAGGNPPVVLLTPNGVKCKSPGQRPGNDAPLDRAPEWGRNNVEEKDYGIGHPYFAPLGLDG